MSRRGEAAAAKEEDVRSPGETKEFTTKAEYEKSLAGGMSALSTSSEPMTLGYWKIRGLAAAARMMFFYKGVSFTIVAYGEDAGADAFDGLDF